MDDAAMLGPPTRAICRAVASKSERIARIIRITPSTEQRERLRMGPVQGLCFRKTYRQR